MIAETSSFRNSVTPLGSFIHVPTYANGIIPNHLGSFRKKTFLISGSRAPKSRISIGKRCFQDSAGAIIWVRFEKRLHRIAGGE